MVGACTPRDNCVEAASIPWFQVPGLCVRLPVVLASEWIVGSEYYFILDAEPLQNSPVLQ